MAGSGVTEELFGNYNFLLEIGGITSDAKTIVGGFKSMSGMSSETEVVEFKQGNDKVVVQPGLVQGERPREASLRRLRGVEQVRAGERVLTAGRRLKA
jgi:hypothetical protein